MKLTDHEKSDLQRRGNGHHYFSCCPRCGYLEWQMTDTKLADDVTVSEGDSYHQCMVCEDVRRRNPEVARWVMNVLSYQERRRADNEQSGETK